MKRGPQKMGDNVEQHAPLDLNINSERPYFVVCLCFSRVLKRDVIRSEKVSAILDLGDDIVEKDLQRTDEQKARVRRVEVTAMSGFSDSIRWK